MSHRHSHVWGRVAVLAAAAGLALAAVGLAPPAAAIHIEQYIEVPQCEPATGQTCPQRPEIPFTSDGSAHIASFTANANGCSDVNIRFLLDGYPQSDWIRVSPSQKIWSPTFVAKQGDRVLSIAAQGIEGGCNTGILNAWGGTVTIDSEEVVGPTPGAVDPAPQDAPCEWNHTGAVNIEQGDGTRISLDQWRGLTAIGPAHMYRSGSADETNSGTLLGAYGEGTEVSFTIIWKNIVIGYFDTYDYEGTIDPEWGTLRGTYTNNAGVTQDWAANEFWTCE